MSSQDNFIGPLHCSKDRIGNSQNKTGVGFKKEKGKKVKSRTVRGKTGNKTEKRYEHAWGRDMIGSGGCCMGSIIIIIITAPVTTESQNVSEKFYKNPKSPKRYGTKDPTVEINDLM